MKSPPLWIVVATTVLGMALAIWLIDSLPGIPYNVRELVAGSNPLIQAILLSGTLLTL